MKKLVAIAGITVATIGLAACESNSGNKEEQKQQAAIQTGMVNKQPIPNFDFSQLRATLIAIENAQAHGVATTSFFYNQGVKAPVFSCPSIGFPIPTTAQLSNPWQIQWGSNSSGVVGQMEPTGVYNGDSSGTYVECVSPSGKQYAKYWEGYVSTIGGAAHFDGNQEVLDGEPTVVTKK
jgi:hypothetical protein